jgi:hypothetical protein
MIEMLTGTHPWPEQSDPFQILFKIINLKENEIPTYDLGENKSEKLYLHTHTHTKYFLFQLKV